MKIIISFCLASLLLVSCTKKVEELPPATETGANTFGARVNGELWVPRKFGPIGNVLEVRFASPTSILINARNFASSPTETEFEILIKDITGPGTFALNTTVPYPTNAASYGYYVKRKLTPENEWITSAVSGGFVTVTKFDMAARIISGTFQFSASNLYNAPSPITVTEGRFDLRIP